MTPRICVLGSINMDLVIQTPRFPAPGETLLGGQFRTYPGGKGENQSVAAARMGAAVSMIACIGDDAYGKSLRDVLAAECVDTTHVMTRAGIATGIALITVNAEGENTIIVAPGANGQLSPHDVDTHRAAVTAADALVMQLETPLASIKRAAEIARGAGKTTILNAAPALPLAVELLPWIDVLIVNRTEAALMAGMSADAPPPALAERLRSAGAHCVVITLGAAGAVARDQHGMIEQRAFPIQPIDTTAAGDAFVGAVATSLASGSDLRDAVRWGCAAGALAATKPGALPSLPHRDEVARLVEHQS